MHCFLGLINLSLFPILMLLTTTWTAILICLQYSFWFPGKGFTATYGFTKAWEYYLKTRHLLVGQKLDDFLKSRGSKDWFTIEYTPSEKECVEFRTIAFNSLLRMYNSCFLQAEDTNISLASPKIST